MHYCLYQITNSVNGKIYVGVHKTKSLEDGYMGSGKIIRSAIAKHGISNFSKDILETFDNAEAMYAREAEIVNEKFLARDDVYNLRRGGHGGFEYINKNYLNGFSSKEVASNAAIKSNLGQSKFNKQKLNDDIELSIRFRQSIKDGMSRSTKKAMLGVTHSDLTKNKMSISHTGNKNSQAGTMWITNGSENKKIKKTDSSPEGFRNGRVTLGFVSN